MLKTGDKIGIVCCSNGQKKGAYPEFDFLEKTLQNMGLVPVFSDYIYEQNSVFSGTARQRADALVDFYQDSEIEAIFDISGGNLANGVLPYLDYDIIKSSDKLFWGYSDLTTVINAIYAKTERPSVLYQIRNLLYDYGKKQREEFANSIMYGGTDLFDIHYDFIQGKEMKGVLVGGNIRCFLKLAGTEYMPDLQDKILLLESYSGGVGQIETYLCQLQQIGAFDKVAGILLGTFTEMEEENYKPTVVELLKVLVGEEIPIAVTKDIGHGEDSKAIIIGKEKVFG